MTKKYPTKKDVEKHTQQLVSSLRQYFRGLSRKDFIKNDFQCLFTDLLLEAQNEGIDVMKVQINFNSFLKQIQENK